MAEYKKCILCHRELSREDENGMINNVPLFIKVSASMLDIKVSTYEGEACDQCCYCPYDKKEINAKSLCHMCNEPVTSSKHDDQKATLDGIDVNMTIDVLSYPTIVFVQITKINGFGKARISLTRFMCCSYKCGYDIIKTDIVQMIPNKRSKTSSTLKT